MVCTLWATGHEFASHRLQTMRWSPGEHLVHARGLFSCNGRGSEARGHQWVSVEDSFQPSAEDPEMLKGQGDRDGQEDELVFRLLAP